MDNPLIVNVDGKDEILLCDEDIFQLIREKLGNEITKEIQRIIDDLQMEIEAAGETIQWNQDLVKELEAETRKLIRQIETDHELVRTDLRNQAMKILKITMDI